MVDLAKEETAKRSNPLRVKKLYVLSALLVEQHQAKIRKNAKGTGVRSVVRYHEDRKFLTLPAKF